MDTEKKTIDAGGFSSHRIGVHRAAVGLLSAGLRAKTRPVATGQHRLHAINSAKLNCRRRGRPRRFALGSGVFAHFARVYSFGGLRIVAGCCRHRCGWSPSLVAVAGRRRWSPSLPIARSSTCRMQGCTALPTPTQRLCHAKVRQHRRTSYTSSHVIHWKCRALALNARVRYIWKSTA